MLWCWMDMQDPGSSWVHRRSAIMAAGEGQKRQADQEPPTSERMARDQLLKTLGIDPEKWIVGDRRIALLEIGIGLDHLGLWLCLWVGMDWPRQANILGLAEPLDLKGADLTMPT
jgi:hypothetical protein